MGFPSELFYKIIVQPNEEDKKIKKVKNREHSPIRTEHIHLNEPRDFKENFINKSFCIKMLEVNKEYSNSNVLGTSQK